MNIIEATKKALSGQKIKRMQKDEWILATDGGSILRWHNNRQRVHLTIADILGQDWVCEEDVIMVSRYQVEEGLKDLTSQLNEEIEKEQIVKFFQHLGFKW